MPASQPRRLYLTDPSQFTIEYEINDWMKAGTQVNLSAAKAEWEQLCQTYRDLGAEVETFDPLPGWPDSVFLGDAIFLYGDQAIASRFRFPERAGEVEPMVARFEERGFRVHWLPEGVYYEGNGETMPWNGRLLAGYGPRSDRAAHDFLAHTLEVPVLSIHVQAPHFHVDTTICPLSPGALAYVPNGMDAESRKRVHALNADLIEIDDDEARLLACNSMAFGNTIILSTQKAPRFEKALEKAGFDVLALDMSEFAQSGGGAKCLTLEAYAASSG